jgi:hypothetical protein
MIDVGSRRFTFYFIHHPLNISQCINLILLLLIVHHADFFVQNEIRRMYAQKNFTFLHICVGTLEYSSMKQGGSFFHTLHVTQLKGVLPYRKLMLCQCVMRVGVST